ncbi:MAG: glycoside hydrolase family 13 protein [Eubacteriales bacterium]|nr:glycoside hydrolase family 13 protein [Eubacteriales bacterium]
MFNYDSTKTEYKSPFGAIKRGDEVIFRAQADTQVLIEYRLDADDVPTILPMQYENGDFYRIKIAFEQSGLYFYRFILKYDNKQIPTGVCDGYGEEGICYPYWQLTVYDEDFTTPNWAKGGLMYQIFPDRFRRSMNYTPGKTVNKRHIHDNWYEAPEFIYDTPDYKADDFFGGNIQGVMEKLSYLKELGVTMIYFNPIFESPENHRYSTGNYRMVDPYFGTNEEFESLTKLCHDIGIKVILDGVFSHTGADSIYFNKFGHYDSVGAYNSKKSPYYHWYSFNKKGYDCWWGFDNLPNVNETAPDYLEYITGKDTGVLNFWQAKGVDGWRLDVADELPDLFIDKLRESVKSYDKDAFIIGEVWEDATNKFSYGERRRYLIGKQLDSVMNYPWRTAIINFVKTGDDRSFVREIMSITENYPPQVLDCLMNSLSTHDTPRIINELGVQRNVKPEDYASYTLTTEEYVRGRYLFMLGAFLQFTLPGIPCIYYGDEVGLTGFKDPYCRMCFPYGREDVTLLDFFRALSYVRADNKEEFIGGIEFINTHHGFLQYKRNNTIFTLSIYGELPHTENKILFSNGYSRIELMNNE